MISLMDLASVELERALIASRKLPWGAPWNPRQDSRDLLTTLETQDLRGPDIFPISILVSN